MGVMEVGQPVVEYDFDGEPAGLDALDQQLLDQLVGRAKERGAKFAVRTELLDHTLVWNLAHLHRVLAEYETFYNKHRAHRALSYAAPLQPLPGNVSNLDDFCVARRDRIGGILHEYHIAA